MPHSGARCGAPSCYRHAVSHTTPRISAPALSSTHPARRKCDKCGNLNFSHRTRCNRCHVEIPLPYGVNSRPQPARCPYTIMLSPADRTKNGLLSNDAQTVEVGEGACNLSRQRTTCAQARTCPLLCPPTAYLSSAFLFTRARLILSYSMPASQALRIFGEVTRITSFASQRRAQTMDPSLPPQGGARAHAQLTDTILGNLHLAAVVTRPPCVLHALPCIFRAHVRRPVPHVLASAPDMPLYSTRACPSTPPSPPLSLARP